MTDRAPPIIVQIAYAPARQRPAWLTWRAAAVALLVVGSIAAMGICFPRVVERAAYLDAQERLLACPPGNGGVVAVISSCGTWGNERSDELAGYTRATPGLPALDGAAFAGGRDGGAGRRLVIVHASLAGSRGAAQPVLSLTTWVVRPGGWVRASVVSPPMAAPATALPIALNGRSVGVVPGEPDAEDASRFDLIVWSQEPAGNREFRIKGHLMADDTVRFEWPTGPEPVPSGP